MPRVRLTARQMTSLFGPRRAAGRPPAPPESALLRQVLQWLNLKGIFAWRANSGGGLRGGRPVRGNPAGTPDVLCVLPPAGRLVGLELKSASGRLRPAQEAWRGAAERAGALHLVVRSLGQLVEEFAKLGVS